MSAYCEICKKGAMSGMNVSHSHLKTKRKWKPNIQ
ncbi:MAG: 50S ribosomal protein L28, partial [Selenomonadaceae bacterium]|nr:50S ribosomal protein L28 [Selenomonadaceae bacterium]